MDGHTQHHVRVSSINLQPFMRLMAKAEQHQNEHPAPPQCNRSTTRDERFLPVAQWHGPICPGKLWSSPSPVWRPRSQRENGPYRSAQASLSTVQNPKKKNHAYFICTVFTWGKGIVINLWLLTCMLCAWTQWSLDPLNTRSFTTCGQ